MGTLDCRKGPSIATISIELELPFPRLFVRSFSPGRDASVASASHVASGPSRYHFGVQKSASVPARVANALDLQDLQ